LKNQDVFILGASRTPMGAFGGHLSSLSAVDLGIEATKNALKKSDIGADEIQAIVMGNVLSANLGQAPARQVSIGSGIPYSACATTVNKVCASGMKAIQILSNDIRLGDIEIGIAGGMESMSSVPFYLPKSRWGLGYGDGNLPDGLSKDGLTDAYSHKAMGVSGDITAEKYKISREEQDDFAQLSYERSQKSWNTKAFDGEVSSVSVPQKKGQVIQIFEDEAYTKANFEKMRQLKPVFSSEGTVTAANSSPLSDGASALVLASQNYMISKGILPKFKIIAYAEAEQEPDLFTTSPVLATQKVLNKAGMTLNDIDFFEVNEAFAVVPLAFMKLLNLKENKLNVLGGAVSLGHPLGSSGSRIVITLMNILERHSSRFGLAAICNGGGGASAIIIEKL